MDDAAHPAPHDTPAALKPLTITVNYYNQGPCLADFVRHWEELPADLLDQVRFVIIDDGSRVTAESVLPAPPPNVDLELYRILVDVPYNFSGTINLGAAVATTPWLLHHDLDHLAAPGMLRQVLALARPENRDSLFRFRLRFPDGRVVVPCSAHMMTAGWFWRLGGVDEDFAGNYGFEDVHFLVKAGRADGLTIVETEHEFTVDDRGACDMHRDPSRNDLLFQEKTRAVSDPAGSILRFPWRRVY